MFPELPPAPRKGDVELLVQKFEAQAAASPDSPIRAIRRTPPRPAVFSDFPETLTPKLREVLIARGIQRLYSHQADAWNAVIADKNVVPPIPLLATKDTLGFLSFSCR